MNNTQLIFIASILLIIFVWYLLIGQFWLKATLSGIRISGIQIFLMRLRGTSPKIIITELIKAAKSGLPISREDLEACQLAGGNPENIVNGLIYAQNKGIELTLKEAFKLDQERKDLIVYLRNK